MQVMPISTTCPHCKAIFRLPEDLAGKKVRCQKCKELFVVPRADTASLAHGESVAKEPAPDEGASLPAESEKPTAVKRAAPPKVHAVKEKVDDDLDDDDDDRDRRRDRDRDRDRDEDDDDGRERRKKKKKPAKSGSPVLMIVMIILGIGFLSVLCCGGIGIVWIVTRDANVGQQGPVNVAFGPDGAFRHENLLHRSDPRNRAGKLHRVYLIQMEANKTYEITMVSRNMDSFLYLVDPGGKVVAQDDDGAGALNSLIIFRPTVGGLYRVEATSLGGQQAGPFSLSVQRREPIGQPPPLKK
jgi:predicted Zn finger-like uncharacterized protein